MRRRLVIAVLSRHSGVPKHKYRDTGEFAAMTGMSPFKVRFHEKASLLVCGVLAEGPDGTVQVNVGAVIIATGGYLGNRLPLPISVFWEGRARFSCFASIISCHLDVRRA